VIAGYGFNYYTLSSVERPLSPKHDLLKPMRLHRNQIRMFGVLLFFLIYLYPLRQKVGLAGAPGNSRHWLDFHVVLAPRRL